MMCMSLKWVTKMIGGRIIVVPDDLELRWQGYLEAFNKLIDYELTMAADSRKEAKRARRDRKVQSYQSDPGKEGRAKVRERGLHWLREIRENWFTASQEDLEPVARLFAQVLFILSNLFQGQRTQVFAEVTVDEFRRGEDTELGRFVEHMGGKTKDQHGSAVAFFLKAEADLTAFYLKYMRKHLRDAPKPQVFPIQRYPAQLGQSRQLLAIIGIGADELKAIMGVGSRRWHNTLSVEKMRAGQLTYPEFENLCSLRRHSAPTAQRDYNMESGRERDIEGVKQFVAMAGVHPDPRSSVEPFVLADIVAEEPGQGAQLQPPVEPF
ncbi:hypothetical protein FJT64_013253 [Amphibalanus amphitrite]|uniref:Uncharacterized protein n=1 Tax=Amphibalanus amphitrite TaxID=1232801 RepID=A0A6A4VD85_AMPAM|nr:hypothetical protein FJT64_013253 [Amphibalanus amphitrite]